MIGTLLNGRYELLSAVVDAPIFSTFAARDRVQGKDVCIRLVKPPFNHEDRFVSQLTAAVHKYSSVLSGSIESMTDLEQHAGNVYIVGELTRGPSLADRIRKLAPFSVPVSVAMAISICNALDGMHRMQLVHGDVSAQNVVVLGDGEAKLQLGGIWEAYSGSPTAGSLVLPAMAPYLAPEVSGGDDPTPSSDVYGVGIILFELLTGRQPYLADTALATAMKHRTVETPSVRAINPSVPEVLDEIIKRAMSKEPSERYRNASDLAADLRILDDALRFGRPLSWPLRGAGKGARAAEPGPVTPRMSAIRSNEEVYDLPRRSRQERDIPVWMLVTFATVFTLAVCLVGFWMLFNLSKPKLVEVPNIKGQTFDDARSMLQSDKLELRISQRVASEKVPADRIIDVSPAPGEKVREGGQVFGTLSLGSRYVEMPDVRSLTLDKATSVLESLGLEVEKPEGKVASMNVPMGYVARQSPAPKDRIERITRVRLFVSTGPPSGDTAQPDTTAPEYEYTVRMTVSRVAKPVDVRIDIVDPVSPQGRTILEEQHSTGDLIERTTQSTAPRVTFVVYYDGVEVKRIDKEADGATRE